MASFFAIIASIFGAIGVVTGAFGAHILEKKLEPRQLITWNKGVDYMLYHAPAIFLAAIVLHFTSSTAAAVACWALTIGVILFSFSLFLLVFSGIKKLGIITPFGGTSFIIGWIALAVAAANYFSTPV